MQYLEKQYFFKHGSYYISSKVRVDLIKLNEIGTINIILQSLIYNLKYYERNMCI